MEKLRTGWRKVAKIVSSSALYELSRIFAGRLLWKTNGTAKIKKINAEANGAGRFGNELKPK